MSKTKGQTFRYHLGHETKTFFYRSRICLIENRLFLLGPESVLLDQIEMISFDGADLGTNSDVLVSFLLDVGTFVERLFLYCFDITNHYSNKYDLRMRDDVGLETTAPETPLATVNATWSAARQGIFSLKQAPGNNFSEACTPQ